jgi:hypothetical protein
MARPAITLEFPDVPGLADEFRRLPKSLASAAIGAAVKRAMQPAQEKLKQITPKGPTGNLRRGIATKAKRYPKTGAAVAVVGYRRPNSSKPPKVGTKRRNRANDQTQHQLLVEYGTKERFTKRGAYRGRMPVLEPIAKASKATQAQVTANLRKEMVAAAEKALKQLPKYLAARAAKGKA